MPIDTNGLTYAFDPTGQLLANRITAEQHIVTYQNFRDYHFIVPKLGPFFAESLVVNFIDNQNNARTLTPGIDYKCTHWFMGASRACARPIYGSISFMDLNLAGQVIIQYQTLGGEWVLDLQRIALILADRLHNPRITAWEEVSGKPNVFPPVDHEWNLVDLKGMTDVIAAIDRVRDAIANSLTDGFAAHLLAENPHQITPAIIGAYSIPQINTMLGGFNKTRLYFMGWSK